MIEFTVTLDGILCKEVSIEWNSGSAGLYQILAIDSKNGWLRVASSRSGDANHFWAPFSSIRRIMNP
jgi:hypothetical protein